MDSFSIPHYLHIKRASEDALFTLYASYDSVPIVDYITSPLTVPQISASGGNSANGLISTIEKS